MKKAIIKHDKINRLYKLYDEKTGEKIDYSSSANVLRKKYWKKYEIKFELK